MAQMGIVKRLNKELNSATVLITRSEACSKCGGCANGLEQKELEVDAINECEAQIGDLVSIDIKQSIFLQAVLIMYTIPLVGMLIGGTVGIYIGKWTHSIYFEGYAIICGLFGLAFTWLMIHKNKARFETTQYKSVITDIITETEAIQCKN